MWYSALQYYHYWCSKKQQKKKNNKKDKKKKIGLGIYRSHMHILDDSKASCRLSIPDLCQRIYFHQKKEKNLVRSRASWNSSYMHCNIIWAWKMANIEINTKGIKSYFIISEKQYADNYATFQTLLVQHHMSNCKTSD